MNIIKTILIVIGLLTVGFVGYLLVGLALNLLWYAVALGLVGAAAYGGYKLFKKFDAPAEIEGRQPTAIADMNDAERALEEYKRKYLPK